MSPFRQLSDISQPHRSKPDGEYEQFLASNQQVLNELLTFIDFADGFTLGFVEINFPTNVDVLIDVLNNHKNLKNIQFKTFDFSDQPDLKFLREAIIEQLAPLSLDPDRKLVVLIQGLERSIGRKEYPPVLQDLNFVRDAYRRSIPYPILFILPDYALTRLAKFAPDFWAWRSGVFLFQAPQITRDYAHSQTLGSEFSISSGGPPESPERVALLESLLMEYRPSPGHPSTTADLSTCNILLHQLGAAYLSQHNISKAQDYLEKALDLAEKRGDQSLQAEAYGDLGQALIRQRHFGEAIDCCQKALQIFKDTKDFRNAARVYHNLGIVAQEQRQWKQAQRYYEQALALFVEFNDRYEQAGTYGQLGLLANAQGHRQQAIAYLMQALQIFAEFQDHHHTLQTLRNLIQIAPETVDENLLQTLASSLNLSVADLNALIQPLGSDAEASPSA